MLTNKETQNDLVKKLRGAIDKLQEEIKLLRFDNSESLKEINNLKSLLKRREDTRRKARSELAIMKRNNDYTNINYVLQLLKEMGYEKN